MPRKLFILYGFSLALIFFAVIYAVANTYGFNGVFITHYDLVRGIDILGNKTDFYIILTGGFAILIANFYFSILLYGRIRFFSYLLAWTTLFFSVLIFLGVFYLLSLNI